MDIEETQQAFLRASDTFTARICPCGEPMKPELISVTMFSDILPRYTVGWLCPFYLHKNHSKLVKANNDD